MLHFINHSCNCFTVKGTTEVRTNTRYLRTSLTLVTKQSTLGRQFTSIWKSKRERPIRFKGGVGIVIYRTLCIETSNIQVETPNDMREHAKGGI